MTGKCEPGENDGPATLPTLISRVPPAASQTLVNLGKI